MNDKDWFAKCMDKIIIRQNNKLYKLEQVFISFCCLTSSFLYFYYMVFGWNDPYDAFFFEFIFLIDIILKFLVEYTPNDGKGLPVRNLRMIAMNYIYSDFIYEILPLIPFQFIGFDTQNWRLLIFLKIIRLNTGITLFNVHQILLTVKKYMNDKL